MNIAITGTMGSGKSYAFTTLTKRFGGAACDADALCRKLMEQDQPGYIEFMRQTEGSFMLSDGTLDRLSLRRSIIEDSNIRKLLEKILHPKVQLRFQEVMQGSDKWKFFEVPLLFELGWEDTFDLTVVIYATRQKAIERVVKRDGMQKDLVEKMMSLQLSAEQKRQRGDYVIDNNTTYEDFNDQLDELADYLVNRKSGQSAVVEKEAKKS